MSFRHAALAGTARRQTFREDVLHGIAEGVFGLGDAAARIDVRAVVPVREDDGRGPLFDGEARRRHVADDVVFLLVRMAAAHQIPALYLLGDQSAAVQLRVGVGLGFEQSAQVGEKAYRADDHAPVGRGGERLAIDVGRVRRVVGVGVFHPFGIGGGEIGVFLVALGIVALGNDDDANVLRAADGDVGATVEGVEDFHGGDGGVPARTGAHREDFALARIRHRVQRGYGAHVVVVRHHVGVKDDHGAALRRDRGRQGQACENFPGVHR